MHNMWLTKRPVPDYLPHTAETGETITDCHNKQVFSLRLQCEVVNFVPSGVPQAATCDGIKYQNNKRDHFQEPQGNFLRIFRD